MERTTQKELRRLVRTGAAIDATAYGLEEYKRVSATEGGFDSVAYSAGMYGVNGALARGRASGTLYAVTARTTAAMLFC